MRRIITLTALALGLLGGVASADRRSDRRDNRWDRADRVVHRDNSRNHNNWDRGNRGGQRWDQGTRYDRGHNGVGVHRTRPVYRNGGFDFGGGVFRTHHRPVIDVDHRDYDHRPAILVENYDPVPGYIWIAGNWQWNGYEWSWIAGRYEVDHNYVDYSGDGYYNNGTYNGGYYNNY